MQYDDCCDCLGRSPEIMELHIRHMLYSCDWTICLQLRANALLQVARLRCALARYLVWEVNASKDFRYQIRHSTSMVHQPCLHQLAIMLKQAGLDHIATTDDRARLLDAIQSSSQSGGHQQLSLQVTLTATSLLFSMSALSPRWGLAF